MRTKILLFHQIPNSLYPLSHSKLKLGARPDNYLFTVRQQSTEAMLIQMAPLSPTQEKMTVYGSI